MFSDAEPTQTCQQREKLKSFSLLLEYMKQTNVNTVAKELINKSTNPLGINFELTPYTFYYGARLQRHTRRADKLIFLERYRGKGQRFPTAVVHTTNLTLFQRD